MPNKLYTFRDRDECHKMLEEVLRSGQHPLASCRENTGDPSEPYTIWDGPDDPNPPPARPAIPPTEEELVERLAEKVAAIIKKKEGL